MEVIELPQKRRQQLRPTTSPAYGKKTTRRYVQPARVESYAPERTYCPPSKPLDANTTYHLSYLKQPLPAQQHGRAVAFRPKQNIETTKGGKFEDGTTSRMSYQPVWGVVRAKPILPRRRAFEARGKMDCTTEARHAYSAKVIGERPQIIVPCGNIRTSSGVLDASTTAGLSYLNPGLVERTASFKPTARYSPPKEPTAKDTTAKLSYQPFRVAKRETYPWAMKPVYKPPDAVMDAQTTYSKSFLADGVVPTREKPFAPRSAMNFLSGEKFVGKTVYSESFLPCETPLVVPVVPSDNISLPNDKMTCDTTSKLSYQPVKMEKRSAIRPATKSMLGEGPMQTETTNRHDFVPTSVPRPEVIIPCDNIRMRDDVPLEGNTTAGLSYIDPGPVLPVQSFKPRAEYMKPTAKIDSETVNKLSYQSWGPIVKQPSLKPRRDEYQLPKERMTSDTIYAMSFPMPGYFIEEDEPAADDVPSSTDLLKTDDAYRNP